MKTAFIIITILAYAISAGVVFLALYEIVARHIPTVKDWSVLNKIVAFVERWWPANRWVNPVTGKPGKIVNVKDRIDAKVKD